MYEVYIVLCKDGSLYTGIAKDAKARLLMHKAGTGAKYTRSRVPLKIVYTERKRNRSFALKREAQIKKLTKAQKLDLIASVQL